ncbi:Reverse transcriptase (RNA-dependent DNA polymerase) [Pristimantis euphronides]
MTLHLQEGRYAFGVSRTQIQARPVLVGKVKMPPVHIPPAAKMVAMKQYRIPSGHKEITETIRELVEVGVMRPTTTAWNNPVWPVKKSDGSWRMTIDYRELNKQMPPLTAAVPDTITIVAAIQSHPGMWYAVIDLANAFFTIPIEEKAQDQFAFTWLGRQYTFTRLPQGWLHSPTICHRVVAEHLDDFALPAGMQFSHYIDDIMIQGDGKERVQEQLTLLIAHMKRKGWEINENKVQGPSEVVKFLGIQWNKGHQEIFPKARQKVINFPIPKNKQETQSYIGLFGFWRQYTPFEQQLLACYRALVETEQLTLGHEVLIRPSIPIMQWVMSNPKSNRVGHAQEQSIIKWKWYISQRAKVGKSGTASLHEKVAEISEDEGPPVAAGVMEESPIKWGKSYEELTEDQQRHTWFMDGSARYVAGRRKWKIHGKEC